MPITSIQRDFNDTPNMVRINSSDTLSTIATTGYLTNQLEIINAINFGSFIFLPSDLVLMFSSEGLALFTLSPDLSSLLPYVFTGSVAVILPVVNGHLASFSGTTGVIADSGISISSLPSGLIAPHSILGNNTGSIAPGIDLTIAQTNTLLGITQVGTAAVGQIPGVATNSSASAGNVGEFIISSVLSSSPVIVPDSTSTDITSISLTAGDWLVFGNTHCDGGGFNLNKVYSWSSVVSATLPDVSKTSAQYPGTVFPSFQAGVPIPINRYSLSTTTIIYLSIFIGTNDTSSKPASGNIFAIRIR